MVQNRVDPALGRVDYRLWWKVQKGHFGCFFLLNCITEILRRTLPELLLFSQWVWCRKSEVYFVCFVDHLTEWIGCRQVQWRISRTKEFGVIIDG